MRTLRRIILITIVTAATSAVAIANSVYVSNVEELYTAVNDPLNVGAKVTLAPGVYSLSRFTALNVERPNRGRLELQKDMSLIGVVGDRSAVVIDASLLPQASYQGGGPPLTGAIRLGRSERCRARIHTARTPDAERLHRTIQQNLSRSCS
ncbi:MAG: hypothetical protein AB7V18_01000 [Pyrinomonadaceae bacterium]